MLLHYSEYVVQEDLQKAARKVGENKKHESMSRLLCAANQRLLSRLQISQDGLCHVVYLIYIPSNVVFYLVASGLQTIRWCEYCAAVLETIL